MINFDNRKLEREGQSKETLIKLEGMYKEWFLDYASYVILERAIPDIFDGFKPVQRRILQSMKDLDDGRYNKVANLVGHCMQYHPHGDASIYDAMVQLGQRELLIDMQGNWGNILTGDCAAAPRYIEARLSKFALDVLFNFKTTQWQSSYDGRRKEPIHLPVKFPIILVHGVEGIAVGLSTKILPHNFNELIEASIKILKNQKFDLYPDFLIGGIADITNYNDGKRGGKVRVRAKISQLDEKTLIITEVPYGITTTTLIESILKANEREKIRIKQIEDNTAKNVEILIHLPNGVSPIKTIDALYVFTNCEISISPICCVIKDKKPFFTTVSDILKTSTDNTVALLKQELKIQLNELEEQWHFASLERIFIEKKVYRDIEKEVTWEGVIQAIDTGLGPYVSSLKRAVTNEDILHLTEIRIKKISKFDVDKVKHSIEKLEVKIGEVERNLDNLISFVIDYLRGLKLKYGKDKHRLTQIEIFDEIEASKVVLQNEKLYVNMEDGFVGMGLKNQEFISDCSDMDDIIVFRENGKMMVSKVTQKTFFGKGIIHVSVFKKGDKQTIYNMVYQYGPTGFNYMKRFNVVGITRDKPYDLIAEGKNSKILYFSSNLDGVSETVTVDLKKSSKLRKLKLEVAFSKLSVKSRSSRGNLLTKNTIKKINLKTRVRSDSKLLSLWFDQSTHRLNIEKVGSFLGDFTSDDRLIAMTTSGRIKTIIPDLKAIFDEDIFIIEKWDPKKSIFVIYYEGKKQKYFVKKFLVSRSDENCLFLEKNSESILEKVITDPKPSVEIVFSDRKLKNIIVPLDDFVSVKRIKDLGKELTGYKVKAMNQLESSPVHEKGTKLNNQTKLF